MLIYANHLILLLGENEVEANKKKVQTETPYHTNYTYAGTHKTCAPH